MKKKSFVDACPCEGCACSQCEHAHLSHNDTNLQRGGAYLLAFGGNATRAVHRRHTRQLATRSTMGRPEPSGTPTTSMDATNGCISLGLGWAEASPNRVSTPLGLGNLRLGGATCSTETLSSAQDGLQPQHRALVEDRLG